MLLRVTGYGDHMTSPRPSRWKASVERRRTATRRMILAGALVGLVGGIVATMVVPDVDSDLRGLVRLAFVLPVAVYVLWWLASPGITLERDEAEPAAAAVDVEERIERIEATFDQAAMPRAGRHSIDPVDPATAASFRSSIRRAPATSAADVAQYGVRHPEPQARLAEDA